MPLIPLLSLLLLAQAPATPSEPPSPGAVMTEEDKTVYAVGLSVWRNLERLELSPAEVEVLARAIRDGAAGKPELSLEEYGPKIDAFRRARFEKGVQKEKERSQAYVEKMAREPGAVKTDSGLVFFELRAGTGASPAATDTVQVHYRGTLVDGTEFDSSYKRGQPARFPLSGVIKCWTEGVQRIKVGGKAKLVCPSSIAYGDRGRPSIPGGAALTFEVELLEVVTPPAASPQPSPRPEPEGD